MEEKLLILNMLKEGKITTDDAVKLLEALEHSSTDTPPSSSRINELRDEISAKLNEIKIDEKLNKFSEKATKFAESFGEKAGRLAEHIGENINAEKIESGTEKFAEEFARKMEGLGQEIAESASKFADAFTWQLNSFFETGHDRYKYSSSYTYPIPEGGNVYLKTSNFSIKAIPGDTKDVEVSISVNSAVPQLSVDEYFKAITEEDGLRLLPEFPGKTWGRIELKLPKAVNELDLTTNNAKCEISNVDVNAIDCSTTNGKVSLTKCKAEKIEIFTDNEKVLLDKTSARTANIRTSNSRIEIEDCHLDNIDAKTSNSAIIVRSSREGDSLISNYTLSTTNGKIDIGITGTEGLEYMVDAHTTIDDISVSLTNLTYKDSVNAGMQSSIQIKSENYDTASDKMLITANTSNASINISNL